MLKLSRLPSGAPEVFASIQGEGPTRGLPSVFVRLALCNLQCTWCDTRYTWDWDRYDRAAEIIDVDVASVAQEALLLGHRNVVLTGGEPLLQRQSLGSLLLALKSAGRRTEVETNGTMCAPELATGVDQWNVSPKLRSSGNPARLSEHAEALRWFAGRPNAYFKFVVVCPSDLSAIHDLVSRYGIPPARVLLMPEASTQRDLAERADWIIPAGTAAGYGFSSRLQITLWGAARGR